MSSVMSPPVSHPAANSFRANHPFDYASEMDAILNLLHKRVFNLEVVAQLAQPMPSTRHHDGSSSQASPQQQSARHSLDSLIGDQHFPSDTSAQNMPSSSKLPPIDPPPNRMKTRAYEFSAIFEDSFNQVDILHRALIAHSINRNNNHHHVSNSLSLVPVHAEDTSPDCSPSALHLAGIITVSEREKLRNEIQSFFRTLMLLFRTALLESSSDSLQMIDSSSTAPSSIELMELTHRLTDSQDRLAKLSFTRRHFRVEKRCQLANLDATQSQLTDRLMEETYRSKVARRYCHDWKANHVLQWIEMLLEIEQTYTKAVRQHETSLRQGDLTHRLMAEMLLQQNNRLKSEASKWQEHYFNESSRFEKELRSFRQEFQAVQRQRQDKYDEYHRMRAVVDEYHQMKMNEKLRREKQRQEEQAMQRIQAWWRGIMTRSMKQKKRRRKAKKK